MTVAPDPPPPAPSDASPEPSDDPAAPAAAPGATPASRSTDRPSRRASPRDNAVAAALLILLAVGFLASAWPVITGPIGDSDEGINAAVWGYDSRAVRELGIVDSRLGGVRTDGSKYATHPPLIVIETAVIERVVGEHPWSTRAAAWLGALATIVVMFFIVRALGLGPPAAAAATVAALAGHMLFVYGAMLDTMVIAFPFALATALLWYRGWRGRTVPRPVLVLLLATVTCLGGWQATFLVALCGLAHLGRLRTDRTAWRRAVPYLAGAAIGVGLTLAWALWTYGSFEVLRDKLFRRTGGEGIGTLDMISFQVPWLAQLLGLGFLAWIACAVSLRDKRFRPLAALSLTTVIVYALVFREGSGGHQYWNYFGLFPAAVGMAYLYDALARGLRRRFPKQAGVQLGVLLAVTALVVAVNVTRPNQAGDLIEAGYRPVALALGAGAPAPDGGAPVVSYVAEPYRIDDWLKYDSTLRGQPLLDAAALRALAARAPDTPVLVLGSCASPDPTGICERLTYGAGGPRDGVAPRVVSAATLAAALPAGS